MWLNMVQNEMKIFRDISKFSRANELGFADFMYLCASKWNLFFHKSSSLFVDHLKSGVDSNTRVYLWGKSKDADCTNSILKNKTAHSFVLIQFDFFADLQSEFWKFAPNFESKSGFLWK